MRIVKTIDKSLDNPFPARARNTTGCQEGSAYLLLRARILR
jgi:hypothetical protein